MDCGWGVPVASGRCQVCYSEVMRPRKTDQKQPWMSCMGTLRKVTIRKELGTERTEDMLPLMLVPV